MSDERPDKCPTCGIAREHDGPHYRKALKQAGKPMCPDPSHDPAPKPQGLDAVSGNGTWDEADERYAAAINAPSPAPPVTWTLHWRDGGVIHIYGLSPADGETVECVPLDRLREAERKLDAQERLKGMAYKKLAAAEAALIEAKRELSGYKLTQSQLLYERDVLRSQLTTLREALETICEIGETRDVEVARAALASLDEQKGDE